MRVISFVNMKGGVGKTTLAVNVADALNRRGEKRVLIVDVDPQFNATQCLYGGDEYVEKRKAGGHTVADLFNDSLSHSVDVLSGKSLSSSTKLDDIKPWSVRPGFDILAGNLEIYRMDMAPGQGRELRLKRFVNILRQANSYDYVIIDTPPTPSAFMNSALLASEYYVVPVRPEPLSRVGIDLLRGVIDRIIENHGHRIDNVGVVVTMADARTNVYYEALEFLDSDNIWQGKRFKTVLPQRTAIARGQGRQELILDSGQADSMRAIAGIMNELLDRVNDNGD